MSNTQLSEKNIKVLRLISNGKTYKEAGIELEIKPRTVQMHMDIIKRKLNAKSISHAVAIAVGSGIVQVENSDVQFKT
jgi:DNA-binding CsgD family transcriptional regulator